MTRLVYMPGVCRECSCDDEHACVDSDGVACHWVEPDLCSACAEEDLDQRDLDQLELEDA